MSAFTLLISLKLAKRKICSIVFNLFLNPTIMLLMFILFYILGGRVLYGDIQKQLQVKAIFKINPMVILTVSWKWRCLVSLCVSKMSLLCWCWLIKGLHPAWGKYRTYRNHLILFALSPLDSLNMLNSARHFNPLENTMAWCFLFI